MLEWIKPIVAADWMINVICAPGLENIFRSFSKEKTSVLKM